MNLSKLQSEAVKEFNRLEMDDGDGCAVCLGEMMSLVNLKLLKDFLTDQIQKAYSEGREEVVKEFDKQWADLGVGGKHPPWHVWIENCQLRCLQGTHLDRKKLSIQSKGKIK